MGVHGKVVKTIIIDCQLVEITDKEIRILELMADGQPNKVIANELRVDSQTIKNYYMPTIIKKLYAYNRAHAVAKAIRKGIIE